MVCARRSGHQGRTLNARIFCVVSVGRKIRKLCRQRSEECLAACAGGPMMQVDHVYHTELTPEKVDAILDALD